MILRLKQGASQLDLTAYPYGYGTDFVPLSPALEPDISQGTSSNRYGGGRLVGETAQNRKWAFTVIVSGPGVDAVSNATRRLTNFLNRYGGMEPLYLDVSFSSLPEPMWGQMGAPLRYEIISATYAIDNEWGSVTARNQIAKVRLELTVAPFASGKKQRLAQAKGSVIQDSLGSVDGAPLGVRINEAGTTLYTNPVFGSTGLDGWNDGWTAGASLVETRNTDEYYVFPGEMVSPLLTARAATNNTYTQSLSLGAGTVHTLSAIVAMRDGSAPTSNDLQICAGGTALSTTFTRIENSPFYYAQASVTGIASALACGLVVKSGHSVFAPYFQAEAKGYRTYPYYGDMLGAAWSGTAHASTSTREAGRFRIPVDADTFAIDQGGLAVTWQPDYASTATGNRYIWSAGSASLRAYFNATDDKFYFTDNSSTVSTSAMTFAAGGTVNLLYAWGTAGMAIYHNGTVAASGASYTPPVTPSYVYIGTDDSAANHAGGLFRGITIYSETPTAAEAGTINAYANGRTGSVDLAPFFWTMNGDDKMFNCDDVGRDNWGVAAGIPGNYPAVTQFAGTVSYAHVSLFQDNSEYISITPSPYFYSPSTLYNDIGGSVDATCSGSAFGWGTVATSGYAPMGSPLIISDFPFVRDMVLGHDYYAFCRVSNNASIGTASAYFNIRIGETDYTSGTVTLDFRGAGLVKVGPLSLPEAQPGYIQYAREKAGIPNYSSGYALMTFNLGNASSAGTVGVDYVRYVPNNIKSIGVLNCSYDEGFITYENENYSVVMTSKQLEYLKKTVGAPLRLSPGQYNILTRHDVRNESTYYASYYLDAPVDHFIILTTHIIPQWGLL